MVGGKQERKYSAEWTKEDAEKALAARLLSLEPKALAPESPTMTLGQAKEKYLAVKQAEGKRSIRDDRQNLHRLVAALGVDTPLGEITASRIADYKVQRAQATVKRNAKEQPIAPATVNRELASLRHLLRLQLWNGRCSTGCPWFGSCASLRGDFDS